jgi:GT2 family glycosyltransferase
MDTVLRTIAEQDLLPAVVVVVDASQGRETERICEGSAQLFGDGVLRYERSQRGLPLQRCRGIEMLRAEGARYISMLDDDVTLAPDFLSQTLAFLESPEGSEYGGVSGYSMIGWAKPFEKLERIYSRLGLYDGELDPGRWLYCGRLVLLSRLPPFEGIHPAEYIPGTHAVWRAEVFDKFLPPRELGGYALWEDVHLSLRVGTAFKLGVLGQAHAWHHRAPGGRPSRIRLGFQSQRRQALVLRDCDPRPTRRRQAAFLAFSLVDLMARTIVRLLRLRVDAIPDLVGSIGGWISCIVAPPRPTIDAIAGADPGGAKTQQAVASIAEGRER